MTSYRVFPLRVPGAEAIGESSAAEPKYGYHRKQQRDCGEDPGCDADAQVKIQTALYGLFSRIPDPETAYGG